MNYSGIIGDIINSVSQQLFSPNNIKNLTSISPASIARQPTAIIRQLFDAKEFFKDYFHSMAENCAEAKAHPLGDHHAADKSHLNCLSFKHLINHSQRNKPKEEFAMKVADSPVMLFAEAIPISEVERKKSIQLLKKFVGDSPIHKSLTVLEKICEYKALCREPHTLRMEIEELRLNLDYPTDPIREPILAEKRQRLAEMPDRCKYAAMQLYTLLKGRIPKEDEKMIYHAITHGKAPINLFDPSHRGIYENVLKVFHPSIPFSQSAEFKVFLAELHLDKLKSKLHMTSVTSAA